MAEITITINDNSWPKLQMVVKAIDAFGKPILLETKQTYDLAYGNFENAIHNVLKPVVDSVVQSKKRGQ